jgi:hypothetical protein
MQQFTSAQTLDVAIFWREIKDDIRRQQRKYVQYNTQYKSQPKFPSIDEMSQEQMTN